jgi:hypothetical protein
MAAQTPCCSQKPRAGQFKIRKGFSRGLQLNVEPLGPRCSIPEARARQSCRFAPWVRSKRCQAAYNVIAGEVTLGLDLRDLDAAKIELLYRKIVAEAQQT